MPKAKETVLADRLRKHSLKVTPLRLAILSILRKSPDPVGAPEIFQQAKTAGANYVTVYRTMKTLEESGIVRRVNLRHNHADYELSGEDHHHLICTTCDRIEDFDGCEIENLAKCALKQSKTFATINDHALEFFGKCRDCAKNLTEKPSKSTSRSKQPRWP